jgi:Uma2 family endonuclease
MQLADLDPNKIYTYADYFRWRFEERVELIKGKIFKMSPAPNRLHQKLTGTLHTKLDVFLSNNKCEVYSAPFDVRFPAKSKDDKDVYTVLQPDICVICDHSKLDDRGCIGAPDIVVEVLSPGNNAKELKNKYDIYEQAAVREYWIVSPQDEYVIIHTLENGQFMPTRQLVQGDYITSTVLHGLSIDITELFAKM